MRSAKQFGARSRAALTAVAAVLLAPAAVPAQEHDAHAGHVVPPAPTEIGEIAESAETRIQIPDVKVLTQDGDEADFFTDLVEGQVVAMNFIFTTCTTICPPMGATFSRLQALLGEQSPVRLISVSVDPVVDTPQRLKLWSERFGAKPGWTLVTGEKPEIDRLLKSLKVFTPEYEDHSPTVLVGNATTGRWQRAYGLAPPAKLAELLAEVAGTAEAP